MKKTATNTKILSLLPWLKLIGPYMLFGFYYGLLATLPLGPSQILCVRSFLLGGNLSGLVSLSGSMMAQLITILSIYYSPIYLILLKPHVLTIVAVPYTLIFCLIIKDFPNYQILRPVRTLYDSRVIRLFLISFLFQILNPILLPNPVLTRLTYLVFFRYSTNKIFLVATFWGWLMGQAAFNYFSKLLLTRVKKDSPMIYLLAKRSIYTTFSIVSVINAVLYMGRAPVSFWTKKFMNESHDKEMAFWEIAEYPDLSWWFFKPWPISFFDPSRGNRGSRFVKNCRSNMNSSFYKGRPSTYFFTKCLTDGKERLSLAALPSLSIYEKQVYRSMAKYHRSLRTCFLSRNWVLEKLTRAKFFQEDLTDRVNLLDTGSSFSKAMGKRVRLTSGKKRRIPCTYDPFTNNFRIRIPVPQTFLSSAELSLRGWEWTEFKTEKRKRVLKVAARKNVLKDWISTTNQSWKNHNYENSLPWDTLPIRSRRMFQFMFKNRVLYDYDVQKILEKIKSLSGPDVTWEEILNLDYEDQALFFTYLKEEENNYQINKMSLFRAFFFFRFKNTGKKIRKLHKIEDLIMDLARNITIYFENDFDVPGGDTDFRYRKLRNVGITSAKGKPRSAKLVKRYAKISDFRRKFLKGSMRSRRRKTLLWKALQDKIRSAFFLRLVEIPILFKLPIDQLTTLIPQTGLREADKNANYRFEEQLLEISPLTEESISGESKLVRSAIAARSDIGPIHNGRGYMLVFQSRFRKFIKIPGLIVLKSIVRFLLRQDSEWSKDWLKWKKEIHINCTFDGEEFSQDELPPRWSREGIQIKIVYPIRLKLWQTDRSRKELILQREFMKTGFSDSQELKNRKNLKRKRPKFTYLTVLGYQTDMPFGTIQKESSFWKPVQKKLIRTCKRVLPRQKKHVYQNIGFILGKVLKLDLILLKIKELSFPWNSNPKQYGEVPSDFNSNGNCWIKTFNSINGMVKLDSNLFKRSDRSISIGGEIHPADTFSKQIVSQNWVEKKFVAGIATVESVNVLHERIKAADKLNDKEILLDPVSAESVLDNTKLANNVSSKQKKPPDSGEIVVNLRIFLAESVEEFVSVVFNLFLKIGRILIYYFNEVLLLDKQLARVLSSINRRKKLSTKGKFPRFVPSSQACLYADFWNVGVEKDLDLDLLLIGKKSSNNCGELTKRDSYNGAVSNLLIETPIHRDFTTTKLRKGNCVNNLVLRFDNEADKIANKFFGEHITKCLEDWGFSNKLRNLDEKIWNNWLDCFYKYNLPSTVWHEIAPRKWKISLNEFEVGKNVANKLKRNVAQSKVYNYSMYAKKELVRYQINNFNRIHRHRNLLQNLTDFGRNGDIQTFSVRQDLIAQRFRCKNRIQKIWKIGGNKTGTFVQSQKFNRNLKKFDLMLWLDPDIARTRRFLQDSARNLKNPLLKDNSEYDLVLDINSRFQEVSNELYEVMLDEREDADYIFRWKWKFETELEKFRNLIALTRMLGNDQDLVTLCTNTEIDSDLLNLRFNATTRLSLLQNLSLISAHRLPLVFDDQDLLYKIINPALKFRSRLKNRANKGLYKKIYSDSYISKIFHLVTERNCKQSRLYNIDDLLLLRRRREFRFLRCLLISKNSDSWRYSHQLISEVERNQKGERQHLPHLPRLSEIQKIKRFLWPSHRFEELACTDRFCLGTTTGSQFAALKIRMYPINPS
uniref:Protein TIC 214 n=1 Tax=Onychium japonicum TaxID=32172 RepID=A0A3G5CPR3_ONYJA|nr:conserved hypothetical chloroplast protein Ycf1 [Onychium japonicum]AYW14835.1 conserved hypothetical chloroplast protein Ycf1 [Onychium japonicum]